MPVLGFGIRPLGPSFLPYLPNNGIIAGSATITSKSKISSLIFCSNVWPSTTWSAPAAVANFCFSTLFVTTNTEIDLPVPFGSSTDPRNCWSTFLTSRFNLNTKSTEASNFAYEVLLTISTASVNS